jgi:extracellular elastinolytic metalloproteinase
MSREIDRREFTTDAVAPETEESFSVLARDVSERLPDDHRVEVTSFDHTTGVPRVVASVAAPAEKGNFVARAVDHVQTIAPIFGLVAAEPEYVPDEEVQRTSAGAAAVHLQQQNQGIPIFQATETVRFNPDGSVRDAEGSSVPIEVSPDAEPKIDAEDAVRRAAEYVAEPEADESAGVDEFGTVAEPPSVDLKGFAPKLKEADADSPRRDATFVGEPFEGDIRAGLMWFPLGDSLRLTWETVLAFPGYAAAYRTLVDAGDGEILYCQQLVQSVAARGHVFRVDGASPREMVDFPLDPSSYGISERQPVPNGWPDDWVASTQTEGNGARAHLGESGATFQGSQRDGVLTFDPDEETGDDQKVLNIFYFNCFMHDYCYLMGFRESSGNFQTDNFGRGGVQDDPVDARAHSGPVTGTANMATLDDGRPPVMNMGLVASTNRHTALDSTVVFHEFMHGVTNRLVGGPSDTASLASPQSRGMGEGWSDWIACTIDDTEVVGSWVVDRPEGIRRHPYDDNFPDGFGDLEGAEFQRDTHAVGEVWCAILLTLNRRLGVPLARELVFDALRLSAANPSFLNMRDDIFTALEHMNDAGNLDRPVEDVRRELRSVFAHFGMGPGAQCLGAQLAGIVADHTEGNG